MSSMHVNRAAPPRSREKSIDNNASPSDLRNEKSLTTQLFDKISDMLTAGTSQKNPNQPNGANGTNKIQDIKQSSSKLTMAAQLQKYKASDSQPQATEQQQPTSNSSGQKRRVPTLNTALVNKQSKFSHNGSFVHPRTTKNNQSNGAAGDHANILVTVSPSESHRSTKRHQAGQTTVYNVRSIKNGLASNSSEGKRVIHPPMKLPLSARGSKPTGGIGP